MSAFVRDWKRELLALSVTVMETCWIGVWLLLAVAGYAPRHSAVSVGVALFLGLLIISWIVRGLYAAGLAPSAVSVTVMILALVSGAAFVRIHFYLEYTAFDLSWFLPLVRQLGSISEAIPREAVALVAVFFVWWRGMSLGSRAFPLDRVGFSFRAGIVLLMWGAAISALLGRSTPILGFAFVYFFFGLLAVGVARVHDLEEQPESGGKVSTRFWLGATLGGIFATLLVALVATQLITVGNLSVVMRWLNPLWKALGFVISGIVYLVSLVLQPLLEWLIALFRSRFPSELGEPTPMPEMTPEPFTPAPPGATPLYLEILKYAIIGLVLLGVLALMILSVRRAHHRATERGRAEEREIDWQWQAPGKGIAEAIRSGLDKVAEILNLAGQFGLGQKFRAAVSIRWIYANLLRLAADAGYVRKPSQTPYEFLPVLRTVLPELHAELEAVTDAYVRSHYGEVPTTDEELSAIQACWERIKDSDLQAGPAPPPGSQAS